MDIKINSHYAISSDSLQWILLKDGRSFWFFTNLEDLLNDYLQLKLRGSNVDAIKDLIKTIKEQQKGLYDLLTSSEFKAKLPILASGGRK